MSGISIVLPTTGPGLGPVVPEPLHSAGVDTYTHRYVASHVSGADGAAVTSWPDAATGSPVALSKDSTGTATLNTSSAAFPFVALAGTFLTTPVTESRPGSLAIVCRKTANSQRIIDAMGVRIMRASNGTFQLAGIGTSGGSGTFASSLSSSSWVCLVATVETSAQALRANQVAASGAVVPGAAAAPAISTSTGGATLDVAELIFWSGDALDLTERTAVATALMAHYGL